jgi:hypothetical protein
MDNTATGTFRMDDDVLYQTLATEVVVLNLKSHMYYGLDGSGARIWELLLEYGQVPTVAERLCAEYEVTGDQALRDVESMARAFCEAGLLIGLSQS